MTKFTFKFKNMKFRYFGIISKIIFQNILKHNTTLNIKFYLHDVSVKYITLFKILNSNLFMERFLINSLFSIYSLPSRI